MDCFLLIVSLAKPLLDSVYSAKRKKKSLKVDVCIIQEMLDKNEIESIYWHSSE